MIVVTAGTKEYRMIVDAQARKLREFGYEHHIYDLGGLGIGTRYEVPASDLQPTVNGDSLPPATFKATLVTAALDHAKPGELVMWMDADCLPVHDLTIPRDYGQFDAAVTLRPAPEIGLSNNPALDYLNSGVVWIRNTSLGKLFCENWSTDSRAMKTDQGALNENVRFEMRSLSKSEWIASVNTVVESPCGARVLVLDAMEWNCWHFPPPATARILHFKRGVRARAKDYIGR